MVALKFRETMQAVTDVIRAEAREKLVTNEAEFMECSGCSRERLEELLKDMNEMTREELELLYKIDRESSRKE